MWSPVFGLCLEAFTGVHHGAQIMSTGLVQRFVLAGSED